MDNPYNNFASAWLDRWQEQLARQMSDPKMVESMLDMLKNMAQAAGHGFASSPSHPAVSPGFHDSAMDALARRLAACEARLTQLEAMARSTAQGTQKPAVRKRARPDAERAAKRSTKTARKPAKRR